METILYSYRRQQDLKMTKYFGHLKVYHRVAVMAKRTSSTLV
jgi:hypothetical protein